MLAALSLAPSGSLQGFDKAEMFIHSKVSSGAEDFDTELCSQPSQLTAHAYSWTSRKPALTTQCAAEFWTVLSGRCLLMLAQHQKQQEPSTAEAARAVKDLHFPAAP